MGAKGDYRKIKKLARQGLNLDQTAIRMGVTKQDLMKTIREHFSCYPFQLR